MGTSCGPAEVTIDFCVTSPVLPKKALQKPAHQMHVAFVNNDSSIPVYPVFFRTIILTVPALRELLLTSDKSANDLGFLSEDDGCVLPLGCQ